MIGGIYLEIPFGKVYKKSPVASIRKNLNKILGLAPDTLTSGNMDKELVDSLLSIGKRELSRHLSSIRREYQHRTSDLIRSTVMAVYKDCKWDGRYYRFDKKQPQEAPPLVQHQWNLESRAIEFLSGYKPHNTSSRFTAVIAATAPYAVRLEENGWGADIYPGYALAVLKYGINRIANGLLNARPKSAVGLAIYGYIFESTEGDKTVKSGF